MSVIILVGDVFARLAELPDDSVDCVVTSPPYWGLRDYGVDGQIGLEPSLGEHLDVMVRVFREVRRVLKPSGTLWLNYGDCYASAPNGRSAAETKASGGDDRTFRDKPMSTIGPIDRPPVSQEMWRPEGRVRSTGVIKPKDLCMIPNRLAIALQDDGWWVRSEIVWGKPNAMPDSSGIYRPAAAHEKIFLLAKSDDVAFWFARDTGEISALPDLAERVPLKTAPEREGPRWIGLGHYYDAAASRVRRAGDEDAATYRGGSYVGGVAGPRTVVGNKRVERLDDKQRGHARRHQGFAERWDGMSKADQGSGGRLLRNFEPAPLPVWEIATRPFGDAHFATFPPDLVARALTAGCPKGGRVLDPFGGAGTTGLVADAMGFEATLIEINPDYVEIIERRLRLAAGGALQRGVEAARKSTATAPLPLFGDPEVTDHA